MRFRPTRDQPGPKLAQDRKIEASIGEFQPSGIFPIHAPPYGISGVSVGQVLRTWQDGDEGQAPGRFGWLSDMGIKVGKLVMARPRPKCIAHLHLPIPTGKGGASDFGGVFRYIPGTFKVGSSARLMATPHRSFLQPIIQMCALQWTDEDSPTTSISAVPDILVCH